MEARPGYLEASASENPRSCSTSCFVTKAHKEKRVLSKMVKKQQSVDANSYGYARLLLVSRFQDDSVVQYVAVVVIVD